MSERAALALPALSAKMFSAPRIRALCLFFPLALLLCIARPFPCAAAGNSIPLPPPLDAMIDMVLGVPPLVEPGTRMDAPRPPQKLPARPKTPQSVLPLFLGIPYRLDGLINDNGQYALFSSPDVGIATPGLNCSGMVLAASRIILDTNIAVADAVQDREGDSGPESTYGQDWDFGFDLVMNVSEGFPRRILLPDGAAIPDRLTGKTAPSFDPHAPEFPSRLFPHLKPNALYLVSFSRHKQPDAPAVRHYHTGILVKDVDGVWMYSTTRGSGKVIRHNLADETGLARFQKSFRNVPGSFKRLFIVEVSLTEG